MILVELPNWQLNQNQIKSFQAAHLILTNQAKFNLSSNISISSVQSFSMLIKTVSPYIYQQSTVPNLNTISNNTTTQPTVLPGQTGPNETKESGWPIWDPKEISSKNYGELSKTLLNKQKALETISQIEPKVSNRVQRSAEYLLIFNIRSHSSHGIMSLNVYFVRHQFPPSSLPSNIGGNPLTEERRVVVNVKTTKNNVPKSSESLAIKAHYNVK